MILARQVDRSVAAARVRGGEWVRVRPGAYIAAEHLRGRQRERTIELARIAALGCQLRIDHVVSHESAALLWGLPVLRVPVRTHVLQQAPSRAGCSPDVVRHVQQLAASDRTTRFLPRRDDARAHRRRLRDVLPAGCRAGRGGCRAAPRCRS